MAPNGRSLKCLHTRTTIHIAIISIGITLALLKYVEVWTWFYWLAIMFCVLVGVWFVGFYTANRYPGKWTKITPEPPGRQEARAFLMKLMGPGVQAATKKDNVITYSNLDETIEKLLDLVIRDFVLSWYQQLGADQERFQHQFKDFIWQMVEEFTRRVNQLDIFEFITHKVASTLTKHLQEIRQARRNSKSETPKPKFALHPWLASEELEVEFIRQAAEVFLIHLLPKSYVQCVNARHLCREIFACKIFKPYIESICEPDYINQKLLAVLQQQEAADKEYRTLYPTYDNYLKIIKGCDDVKHLKQIRSSIISEVLHTITNKNFKKTPDTSPKRKSKCKTDLGKNLTLHVKQLSAAKSYCERRIQSLGGPAYTSCKSNAGKLTSSREKIFSFCALMEDKEARNHFMTYLVRSEDDVLLKFWAAVEAMKKQKNTLWQKLAREIYNTYITSGLSRVRAILDASTLTAMEQYLSGENGPHGFWSAITEIHTVLKEKHFPNFIISDIYCRLIANYQHMHTAADGPLEVIHNLATGNPQNQVQHISMQHLSAHLSYAQHKLRKLAEQLEITIHALQAIYTGQALDTEMHKINDELEHEIHTMRTQQKQLEFHIEHTQVWIKNRGKWKAHIPNAEIIHDEGKMVPYFVLVVHEIDAVKVSPQSVTSAHGWVVFRRLEDFHSLHSQLVQIQSSLQSSQLPKVNKSQANSLDPAFLNTAKQTLQEYINEVLSDKILSHSEAAFAFLSPSPEFLQPASISHSTRNKHSFFKLFNGLPGRNHVSHDSDMKFSNVSDSKAEALYILACDVLELRSMMHRLTETLRMFIHITFNSTINCHLQSTIEWLFDEDMLTYYLESFVESHWPSGHLATTSMHRTPEQQHTTRVQAKQALINSIPGALKNFVGDSTCKQGVTKLFEAFQDARFNKHLFYSLLQDFMLEIFPELKAFQKSSQSSEADDQL